MIVSYSDKANVVSDALCRKKRVISRRVRGMILVAQSETCKQENVLAERLHGLDQQMERKGDESFLRYLSENEIESPWILSLNFQGRSSEYDVIWVMVDRLMKLAHFLAMQEEFKRFRLMIYLVVLADTTESVRDAIGFEYCLASSSGWTKSPVLWAEIGEGSLIGPDLVLEMIDKVVLIKGKIKAVRDRQKSYADNRLRLTKELSEVHDTFHVSNLKEYWTDANMHVPLERIKVHKTLRFVKEPVKIFDREVKSLKPSRISTVKVCWNSKRGYEDFMKTKYPHVLIEQVIVGSTN
ncbi:hypothetical protein Tco_0855103 [Tanacetum coccineum]